MTAHPARLVFLGASAFGLRCFEFVERLEGCVVAGAVTVPQTFPISYRPQGVSNVLYADVSGFCAARGIDCALMEHGMGDPQLLERVRSWQPDAFLVAGWYHLVPKAWRAIAPAYGLHASLLPDYSGGAPLVWAIINGETRTGITLFELADGVDNGPILGQRATDITEDDTIATLYARVESLGLELLSEAIPQLIVGTVRKVPQDESRRRVMPQRSPEDGRIDWMWPCPRVHDFIRAQTRPYPGAFTHLRGRKVTIWASLRHAGTGPALDPGEVASVQGRVLVGCGAGLLEITRVAVDGGDRHALEWLNGSRVCGTVTRFEGDSLLRA